MNILYGLDAFLGIVVSLVTLIGFFVMFFRGKGGAGSQSQTQVTHAAPANTPAPQRRGFPLLKVLLILGIVIAGLMFWRTGARMLGGYSGSGGGGGYERPNRRDWDRPRYRRDR